MNISYSVRITENDLTVESMPVRNLYLSLCHNVGATIAVKDVIRHTF